MTGTDRRDFVKSLGIGMGAALSAAAPVAAAPAADTADALRKGSEAFLQACREVETMLRGHPDADAGDLADAYTYMAGMWHFFLTRAFKGSDVDRPCFVRDMESFRSWGLPSPNHHYYSAQIDGTGTYRILGHRGTTADYCFEILTGLGGDDNVVGERIDALESSHLVFEPDGRFELVVGGPPQKQNWMRSSPKARYVFVRQTVSDWNMEQPTPMLIERIDGDRSSRPFQRPSAMRVAALYQWAAQGMVDQMRYMYENAIRWGTELPLNHLDTPVLTPTNQGYFPGQFNSKCRWQIGPDEALLISFAPPTAGLQSLDLAHPLWFNSIYPRDIGSSLTAAQSRISNDGLYRYVIAATDPGYTNWLDTGGLTRGFLMIRLQRVTGQMPPTEFQTKLVRRGDLTAEFPANEPRVTPRQRMDWYRMRPLSDDRRYF